MNRFCPKCGKEIEDNTHINNFCVNCYIKDNPVIKVPVFQITVCPKCGTLKYAKKSYKEIEALERDLAKHIRVTDLEQAKTLVKLNLDYKNHDYNVEARTRALIGNTLTEIRTQREISLWRRECEYCSKIAGHYFTTILQLRFDDEEIKEKLMFDMIYDVREKVNKTQSEEKQSKRLNLVKEVTHKTGIDFYFDNLEQTLKILQQLIKNKNAKSWQKTRSLVSQDKKGKRIYRHTLCIHFESGPQKVKHIT